MSLRTRLLLAFAAVVLIAIALLVFGLRQEMARRLSHEYQFRVDRVVEVIREDLARESAAIAERLASLESALLNDNRFRLAAVAGIESERAYLLDYAATAMRLTGLSMLQIQDGDGTIISSGHFRNEHGRVEAGLAPALASARGPAFVAARSADREFLALARAQSFQAGGRAFTIVGGIAVDEPFLGRLARDRAIVVSLTIRVDAWQLSGSSRVRHHREMPATQTMPPLANFSSPLSEPEPEHRLRSCRHGCRSRSP